MNTGDDVQYLISTRFKREMFDSIPENMCESDIFYFENLMGLRLDSYRSSIVEVKTQFFRMGIGDIIKNYKDDKGNLIHESW